MIQAHNCFPKDWIGKSLKKANDMTYFVDGSDSKQVSMPSGYGKPISAQWLPNGVLKIETDTNGTKAFFVGFQRVFFAYGNQQEPDDPKYKRAVEECQRLRAEEDEVKTSKPKPKKEEESKRKRVRKEKSEDNSLLTKIFFTLFLILPLWWCIKVLIAAIMHWGGLILLIPWRIITWPFRALLSSDIKIVDKTETAFNWPHYSFAKF